MSISPIPVDRKVAYGSTVAAVTGVVAWALTAYVFHGHLPQPVQDALPAIVATILGAVTAWYTKHAPKDFPQPVAVAPTPPITKYTLGDHYGFSPSDFATPVDQPPVTSPPAEIPGQLSLFDQPPVPPVLPPIIPVPPTFPEPGKPAD